MQVIVYRQDGGLMAVVYPTPEALELMGIHAIAQKDVPSGRRFKLMNLEDIPQERGARLSWTIPEDELTDGIGGIAG